MDLFGKNGIISILSSDSLRGLSGLNGAIMTAAAEGNKLATALKAVMGALAPLGPALVAIGVAAAAIAVVDYLSLEKAFGRLVDQADKARDSLSSTQGEIDSLSKQLEDLYAQIDAIESSGPLSITDQAQLDLLKQQTAELETQKQIQENLEKVQTETAARKSADVLTSKDFRLIESTQVSRNGYGQEFSTNTYRNADVLEATQYEYDEMQRLIKERAELQEEQAKLTPEFHEHFWEDDTQYEKNQKRLQQYDDRIEALSASVTENVGIINNSYANLFDTDGSVISGFEGVASRTESFFAHMSGEVDIATEKTDQLAHALEGDLSKQVKSLQEWDATKLKSEIDKVSSGVDEAGNALWEIVEYAYQNDIIPDKSIDSVNALIGTMEELGYITTSTIDQIASGVDLSGILKSAQTEATNLVTALKEASSATGLTSESIANIKAAFGGLASYDPAKLFERTATGVRLNKEAMGQLNKEYEASIRSNYDAKIQELTLRYGELVTQIDSGTLSIAEYNSVMNDLTGIQNEIQEVQLLKSEYDALTSSYNEFVNAQAATDDRSAYSNIADSYKAVKELLDQGWSGDSEVTSYLDLMLGENWRSDFGDAYAAFDQLTSKIGDSGYSLMDFFQYDKDTNKLVTDGLYNFLDTVKALDDSLVQVDEQGNYSFDWSGRVEEVADKLGTSVEMVELMELALRDAGFDIWFDPLNEDLNSLDVNVAESIKQLEAMKPAAMAAVDTLRGFGYLEDVSFDFSTTDIKSLNRQLKSAKDLMAEMTDEDGEVSVEFKENGYAELNAIIITLLNQKHLIEQPAIMRVDTTDATSDVQNLISLLQEFWNLQNDRDVLLSLNADADTSQVDSQIDSVLAKIKDVPDEIKSQVIVDTEQLNSLNSTIESLTADTTVPVSAEVRAESIESIKAAVNSIDPKEIDLPVNSDDALGELKLVNEYTIDNKTFDVNVVDNASPVIKSIRDDVDNLHSKTITLTTTRVINTRTSSSSGALTQARGTARNAGSAFSRGSVSGRAYKNGDWRIGVAGNSLGGELGPELLVRNGRWQLIGDDSAEFFNHKPNDIIFNAEQTKQLLESGKIKNGAKRGHAYADGTVGGLAFSGEGRGRRTSGSTVSASSKSSSSSSSKSSSRSSGSSNKSSSDSSSTKSSVEKGIDAFKEWVSSLFDWVEVLIQRRTAKIEAYVAAAEVRIGHKNFGAAAGSYISALSDTYALSAKEKQAQAKYTEQANKVLSQAVAGDVISKNVARSIRARVADGTIAISKYSEEVQEVIKSYQTWADKARDAKSAVEDLHANVQKYVGELKNLRDAQRDAAADRGNTLTDIATSPFAFLASTQNNQSARSYKGLMAVNTAYANNVTNVQADLRSVQKKSSKYLASELKTKNGRKVAAYKKALKNAQTAIKNGGTVATADMNVIAKYSRSTFESLYAYNLMRGNLNTARLEYATTYAANQSDAYQNISDQYAQRDTEANNTIELLRKQSSVASSAADKNSLLSQAVAQYETILLNDRREVTNFSNRLATAATAVRSGVAWSGSSYKSLDAEGKQKVKDAVNAARNAVKSGVVIPANTMYAIANYYSKGYISQGFYESCILYNNAIEYKAQAENQLEIDKATIKAEKAAIGAERLSNVQKEFENLRSGNNNGINRVTANQNLRTASGQDLGEQDYKDLITYNTRNAEILRQETSAARAVIQENLTAGLWTTTSQEYIDAVAAVSDLDVSLDETLTTIEGLKDSLRDDVYWRNFDRAHDAVERLGKILSGVNDLIDDDSIFGKDGKLTDFGVARVAMLTKELSNARKEVQNYSADIENLNRLYADGQYTEQEYTEKLNELQASLLDSASDAKSFTDSLVDIFRDMAKTELDALLDLVDARKDALKSKKDYYDYDKKLRSKTNDIQALESQLAALEGIETVEARARAAKLSAELSEKRDDLDELTQDHAFDLTSDALDGLKDVLQDAFDDKWDHISGDLSSIMELITASNNLAAQSSGAVQETLNRLLSFYGISPVQTGISASYASGTRHVPRNMWALTNENGPEIIATKNGIITNLPIGSGVSPADVTAKLFDMAENYDPRSGMMPGGIVMPKVDAGNMDSTINQYYDSLIHIDGSADAATVEDLKRMRSDLLQQSYRYTSQKINEGRIKAGGNRRI